MQQFGQGIDEQQGAIEVCAAAEPPPVLTIVISKSEETNAKGDGSKGTSPERQDKASVIASVKKGFLCRSDSECEECRVCQQLAEEPLIDLGCGCRGELAKAHRSCIEIWFRTRGSNKCEICQQVAVNVPLLDSQPTTKYWVWRVDSAYGGSNIGRRGRERGCLSPLWVAFAILIGGLLLDVLVSVSLGVSALPVNIIIGVLIVLGLGTAVRLALECCHEWGSRRHARGTETDITPGYNTAV
ncbi:uncharacterized protein LOC110097340 isoform X1 [Dendrobium catenatum]|uniref:uncharacterized protein LOC110097340 isoform X1 n=1 Tax=Dendrobium catenatum TaxID=906689 RepID=UPI0009F35202|nr:uncharacterized protein LOC110097340 isoform X1 [Dendrobium catenatum]XP_020679300.1 uncharacterized protein LOC110097340 isoform X1 [Dendrobium catenatum]XP_020679301.1 uncharacterized protein LOC110097340 isoform X1 [Dendrobium catenatum]XP_020679302.1 uncharacterized protein LOC110097340 isoform X1 [Dendrobium catenatum]XP_028549971.1 uncharacterized protein LOC110097340 isoform X1 [Dendrobium catenatum]